MPRGRKGTASNLAYIKRLKRGFERGLTARESAGKYKPGELHLNAKLALLKDGPKYHPELAEAVREQNKSLIAALNRYYQSHKGKRDPTDENFQRIVEPPSSGPPDLPTKGSSRWRGFAPGSMMDYRGRKLGVFLVDGEWYVLDVYTGTVYGGPYDTESEAEEALLELIEDYADMSDEQDEYEEE